jgi:hypothetical protein
MSNSPLRKEKNCLNCGAEVNQRFCPECGQENTVNHPSFHYLFAHFFEDLLHYDSGFWKTMKTLLFKPGIIVREYLSGKRKTYMPPVKLYIFISFITFFLPHILPDFGNENETEKTEKVESASKRDSNSGFERIEIAGVKNVKTVEQLDSIQKSLPEDKKIPGIEYKVYQSILKSTSENNLAVLTDSAKIDGKKNSVFDFSEDGFNFGKYKNIKTAEQLDSIDNSFPEKERLGWGSKKMFYKLIELRKKERETGQKFSTVFWDKFINNLPKALFLYLPFFAFFLWLFHSKKKWVYYDHGIFTLYYFSFLLILTTFNILLNWFLLILDYYFSTDLTNYIGFPVFLVSFGYSFFYFFRSHSRVYGESKAISRLKSFVLFWVNWIFILITLMVYTMVTFFII